MVLAEISNAAMTIMRKLMFENQMVIILYRNTDNTVENKQCDYEEAY